MAPKTEVTGNDDSIRGIRMPEVPCGQPGISAGGEASLTAAEDKPALENPNRNYPLKARMKAWDSKGASDREYCYGQPVGKEIW